jgi:drug/metabolite transporter (DMT)-like permease
VTTVPASEKAASSGAIWGSLWIVYIVWGSTYLGIAIAIESMPPSLSLGLRFLVAGTAMATFVGIRHGWSSLHVTGRQAASAMLVGAMLLGFANGNLALAESYVPSGVCALLVAVNPLWIVIFRAISGDRPRGMTLVGVFIGLVGVGVLVLPGDHVASIGGATSIQRTLWSLVVVAGTFVWALGSFIQRRLDVPSNPLVLTTYQMWAGGIFLSIFGLARGESFAGFADATLRSWLGWTYLVVFGSLIAFTAFVWLLGHAPLSLISTYAYVNPVVAVLLGWLFKAEPFTSGVIIGGAIIVSGVMLVVSGERPVQKIESESEVGH